MGNHLPGDTSEADLVLYDGLCGLCDGFVQFVARRDRAGNFRFAPLQSPVAARRLAAVSTVPAALPDTVIVVSGGRLLLRSEAVLRVLGRLGGGWRLLARLLGLLPPGLRDAGYDLVARQRSRLFGRGSECRLPDSSLRARFLWD